MIVRRLQELEGSDRVVEGKTWASRRLLLAEDGMGFSVHDTLIHGGTETHMEYKNHLEAVYCVEGKGSIVKESTGERWEITPGTIYALNEHDKHVLYAEETLRLVCVFNPPVVGPETHGPDGAYPLMTLDDVKK